MKLYAIMLLLSFVALKPGTVQAAECGPWEPDPWAQYYYSDPENPYNWGEESFFFGEEWEAHIRREFRFKAEHWRGMGTGGNAPWERAGGWSRTVNALAYLQGAPSTFHTEGCDGVVDCSGDYCVCNGGTVQIAGPPVSRAQGMAGAERIRTAYLYVQRTIRILKSSCKTDASATTGVRNKVTLKRPFFFLATPDWANSVSSRASILMHEARHADGCIHNGNDRGGRCRGKGCEESLLNGCWGSNNPGPNTYQVTWLVDLLQRGRTGLTEFERDAAADRANYYLDCRYDSHPGIRVRSSGDIRTGQSPVQCN